MPAEWRRTGWLASESRYPSPPMACPVDMQDGSGGKGVPYSYWCFGGTDPAKWMHAKQSGRLEEEIPINHSAYFAPVIQPTMTTGVDGLVVAALSFLLRRIGVARDGIVQLIVGAAVSIGVGYAGGAALAAERVSKRLYRRGAVVDPGRWRASHSRRPGSMPPAQQK